MSLPFFKALNPTSTQSGIRYSLASKYYLDPYNVTFKNHLPFLQKDFPCQNQEMIDVTLIESVRAAINNDFTFSEGIIATFDILVGNHYDLGLKGKEDCKGGAKGVLDFLILPLLARKLIADSYLPEQTNTLNNVLAWAIARPIEIARISAGLALTVLLAPIVALIHVIKALITEPGEDPKPDARVEQFEENDESRIMVTN